MRASIFICGLWWPFAIMFCGKYFYNWPVTWRLVWAPLWLPVLMVVALMILAFCYGVMEALKVQGKKSNDSVRGPWD